MFLGILGTKEYRKPEWVTHMEELSAALKGKSNMECSLQRACSNVLSADSLENIPTTKKYKKEGKQIPVCQEFSAEANKESFYLTENVNLTSQASSRISVLSEPIYNKAKVKNDFVNSAMAEYLNSHRHSLSSVLELIDSTIPTEHEDNHYKSFDILKTDFNLQDPRTDVEEIEICEFETVTPDPFYILSPIEEKSEPSTTSSSLKDSNGSGRRKCGSELLIKYSSSCNAIPSHLVRTEYLPEKFQTFPRVKNEIASKDHRIYENYYNKNTMYPLEPRELDPSAFFQLHTADSQEELQEFLLLESECMGDSNRGRGLASAFDESTYTFPPSIIGKLTANL